MTLRDEEGRWEDDGGTVLDHGEDRTATLLSPPRWEWRPLPDITAHELALALPVVLSGSPYQVAALLEGLRRSHGERVVRHFKKW